MPFHFAAAPPDLSPAIPKFFKTLLAMAFSRTMGGILGLHAVELGRQSFGLWRHGPTTFLS